MPTVNVTNGAVGTLTLTLRSPQGKVYTVQATAGEEAHLQVPAGTYTLSITSDMPAIRPNYGDATFQRFKQYDAVFVLGDVDAPIHIGD